jgi:hypothetical protein
MPVTDSLVIMYQLTLVGEQASKTPLVEMVNIA